MQWSGLETLHIGMGLAMTCGTGLRFIVDLEKGKPTCHIGKTLQVLQALGLSIEIGQIGGNETGGKKS